MAALDSDVEELTKAKRKATSFPKKSRKRKPQTVNMMKCPCGSTIPVPKGTKRPTCNIHAPQILKVTRKTTVPELLAERHCGG